MIDCIGSDFNNLYENVFPFREGSLFAYYDISESKTKVFQLSSIIEDIVQTFIDENDIGSMAYENKKDYAKIYHDHDYYTSATYIPETSPELSNLRIKIGDSWDIKTITQSKDHSEEAAQEYAKYRPKIGTLVFAASNNELGDGWVLANGTAYTASSYQSKDILLKYYGTGADQFTVPNINSFFKPITSSNENGLESYSGKTSVEPHTHTITAGSTETKIEIKDGTFTMTGDNFIRSAQSSTTNTTENTTHNGTNNDTFVRSADMNADYSFNLTNIKTSSTSRPTSDTSTQTYPRYQSLDAYIYIGYTN